MTDTTHFYGDGCQPPHDAMIESSDLPTEPLLFAIDPNRVVQTAWWSHLKEPPAVGTKCYAVEVEGGAVWGATIIGVSGPLLLLDVDWESLRG